MYVVNKELIKLLSKVYVVNLNTLQGIFENTFVYYESILDHTMFTFMNKNELPYDKLKLSK